MTQTKVAKDSLKEVNGKERAKAKPAPRAAVMCVEAITTQRIAREEEKDSLVKRSA